MPKKRILTLLLLIMYIFSYGCGGDSTTTTTTPTYPSVEYNDIFYILLAGDAVLTANENNQINYIPDSIGYYKYVLSTMPFNSEYTLRNTLKTSFEGDDAYRPEYIAPTLNNLAEDTEGHLLVPLIPVHLRGESTGAVRLGRLEIYTGQLACADGSLSGPTIDSPVEIPLSNPVNIVDLSEFRDFFASCNPSGDWIINIDYIMESANNEIFWALQSNRASNTIVLKRNNIEVSGALSNQQPLPLIQQVAGEAYIPGKTWIVSYDPVVKSIIPLGIKLYGIIGVEEIDIAGNSVRWVLGPHGCLINEPECEQERQYFLSLTGAPDQHIKKDFILFTERKEDGFLGGVDWIDDEICYGIDNGQLVTYKDPLIGSCGTTPRDGITRKFRAHYFKIPEESRIPPQWTNYYNSYLWDLLQVPRYGITAEFGGGQRAYKSYNEFKTNEMTFARYYSSDRAISLHPELQDDGFLFWALTNDQGRINFEADVQGPWEQILENIFGDDRVIRLFDWNVDFQFWENPARSFPHITLVRGYEKFKILDCVVNYQYPNCPGVIKPSSAINFRPDIEVFSYVSPQMNRNDWEIWKGVADSKTPQVGDVPDSMISGPPSSTGSSADGAAPTTDPGVTSADDLMEDSSTTTTSIVGGTFNWNTNQGGTGDSQSECSSPKCWSNAASKCFPDCGKPWSIACCNGAWITDPVNFDTSCGHCKS